MEIQTSLRNHEENVSEVPRSLQSCVTTIQTVVLTADVFQLFIKLWVIIMCMCVWYLLLVLDKIQTNVLDSAL